MRMQFFVLPIMLALINALRIACPQTVTIKYYVQSSASALLYPSAEAVASREVHRERASDHRRTVRQEQLEQAVLAGPKGRIYNTRLLLNG